MVLLNILPGERSTGGIVITALVCAYSVLEIFLYGYSNLIHDFSRSPGRWIIAHSTSMDKNPSRANYTRSALSVRRV